MDVDVERRVEEGPRDDERSELMPESQVDGVCLSKTSGLYSNV